MWKEETTWEGTQEWKLLSHSYAMQEHIIKLKKKKNPTSEKNHPLRLICSNEINVMAIRQ